jgi:hypothetical protein
MKNLFRFYCIDCDNAWMEILDEEEDHSKCEYCNKPQKAEEVEEN